MAWYTCSVNNVGPATDGTETSVPVVYINLTDTGNNPPAFVGQWFYAAEGGQDQMLDVALAAMNGAKHVGVSAEPPNSAGSPYTRIKRLYLAGTGVPATQPVLVCSVSSMNFSTKKPAPPPLKLTNTGTAPLIISSMVVGNSKFSVGKNCIGTIAPGQSCLVRVACHFTGAPDADLVITHNATGSPTVIDLSSEGPDGGY